MEENHKSNKILKSYLSNTRKKSFIEESSFLKEYLIDAATKSMNALIRINKNFPDIIEKSYGNDSWIYYYSLAAAYFILINIKKSLLNEEYLICKDRLASAIVGDETIGPLALDRFKDSYVHNIRHKKNIFIGLWILVNMHIYKTDNYMEIANEIGKSVTSNVKRWKLEYIKYLTFDNKVHRTPALFK